ncbi:MAG: translocation/assembly module TamB domain-containing protein [Candidatus Symbiothrix sp.]|nr:translocation/assembly module TamB domain-containing protein [Candidatus Symbiothrix sp.]
MKKTKNQMHIGNLKFSPFNHIRLENVYVSGLQGDTLLYAGSLDAGFNLFKLADKKLLIHSVELDDFNIRISRDSTGATFNFQFLIDAFATPSSDSSAMQIEIDKVILNNGNLSYNVLSETYLADSLFDVNHISVQNLQAGIHLQSIDPENLKADIAYLSFTEKSGFRLDDLHFNLKSKQKVISLNDFAVELPHSELKTDDVELDYTGLEIKDIFAKAGYSLRIFSGKISPADLIYFYPLLNKFPDVLSFSGKLEGQFPGLNIPFLELNYGDNLSLVANAKMSDLYNWEKSAFAVQIDNCLIDKLKSSIVLNKTNLTGKINGSLPDLHFNLQGESEQGDLNLQGKGGYMPASGDIDFDLEMTASNLNLKQFLSDSTYGIASFQAVAHGKITGKRKIDANLETGVSRFDYKDYSYRNVSIKASYINENIEIDINSGDENLPLTLRGSANLNEKNQEASLHANLYGVRLDILNWLPEYPGAKLSGLVDAHVKGFNPETMTASAMIDSLRFSTQTGIFNDSPITINYIAGSNRQKQLNVRSKVLNVRGKGIFTYDGINRSLQQAFPTLFPEKVSKKRKIQLPEENFNFFIAVRQANTVSHLLGMESEIPDSAILMGKYNSGDSLVSFDATAFCLFSAKDTSKLHLNLSNYQNKLAVRLDVNNRSDQYDLTGNTDAEIEFIRNAKNTFPDMHIELNPGSISLNETAFRIYPAQINIRDKHYEINNFALRHSSSEYLKIDGVVSEDRNDSLLVDINRFEIKTILDALKYNIPISGSVSGEISLSRLTSEPRVITRNFSVNNILFNNDSIGNLRLISGWSSARQGLFLRATLSNPNTGESVVSGFMLPGKDSIALAGNIQGIQLNWFDDYLAGSVYGLDGEFSAKIRIDGKISAPALTGRAYLRNAKAGVAKLNTMYLISDSIELQPDKIIFKDFTVYDEYRQTGKINGTIGYKNFSNMNPKLTVDFKNFLVLNNVHQTDSLFFGRLNINGQLNVSMKNKNWLIQGNLTHGKSNSVMANIPETVEAQRYGWITFVDAVIPAEAEIPSLHPVIPARNDSEDALSLPMKLNLTFSVNPGLSAGVILNPATGDIAQVQGNGNISLSYDLNNMNMSLLGNYIVEDGNCSLSLKNITRKIFHIRNGGKLVFKGDPLNTTFDLTAVYSLKASLTSLDPSFAEITSSGKIPVNCLLTVSGNMKKPQLQYQVVLPNEQAEIQRKLDGLLYTDDIKIKEIAYLLALGSFMPVSSGAQTTNSSSIWTSIASSSVTSQLNSLLAGVLSDNWTIGTDLYSSDGSMSKMDMDVNISTKLFDDRLVVNSTLGYHTNANPGGQTDNFTGDFDLEYKLSPGGNVLLHFFNITNNRYYEKAKTTQGVGIVYKRQGKTFKQLFRSFRTNKKQKDK